MVGGRGVHVCRGAVVKAATRWAHGALEMASLTEEGRAGGGCRNGCDLVEGNGFGGMVVR